MANRLTGRPGDAISGYLLTENSDFLTDGSTTAPPATTVFPLMLGLRLRLHAAWLLFMLIPSY
jgi:hypothetical protein